MSLTNIGRYEIEQELAHGGMAVVYRARDPYMKRQVAVKLLPHQPTTELDFRVRFQQEAEIIAALEHTNIVSVYDYGEHEQQPFIVMRYMRGGTLAGHLQNGPITLRQLAPIVEKIAGALDAAHGQNVIHRDLKPGNILFDEQNQAFLADFGLAKILESTTTQSGSMVCGTPSYMSPEQIRALDIDGRSDIYSLGVIIYEALSGQIPFRAKTALSTAVAHLTDPIPSILDVKPDLPAGCELIIERALAKEPEDRYQTAAELANAVNLVAAGRWYHLKIQD
jgi:eukaryotic-like serine/threonine-protein kinase